MNGDPLEALDALLARARAGEAVEHLLATLPPELAEQARAVLEAEGRLLAALGGAPAPHAAGDEPVRAGQVVGGRYLVEGVLGRGGMGVVYRARDPSGQPVVLKFLAPEQAMNPKVRRRFVREAEAMQKVGPHPHLVAIHAVEAGGDEPYLVMELVEGTPLSGLLQRHGRLAPEAAARVVIDVALGLAVVHRHGLLHRDLKPANVLVTPQGRAKLVDFGLAKDLFRSTLTAPGALLGTAAYMAPEQWEQEGPLDARCDVFGLGATLYHALAGAPPFEGEHAAELWDAISTGEYEPLRARVPELPEPLEEVVDRMLAADRRLRYPRLEAVAEDLERALRGEPARVPCLVAQEPAPLRFALVRREEARLGREGCDLVLADATVSRQHALVRREERGFVLRDLKSSHGTFVNGARLTGSHVLRDGDRIRLGDVELVFSDPLAEGSALEVSVARAERRDPLVQGLLRLRDPRCAAHLLERLAPDPWVEAWVAGGLSALLGAEVAAACGRWRAERAARVGAALPAVLAQVSGAPSGSEPSAWLAWWDHARLGAEEQLDVPRLPRRLRLRTTAGEPAPLELELAPGAGVRLGRDPRCDLRLTSEGVSRHHATVYPLHRRLVVADAGGRSGTRVNGAPARRAFLDPGAELTLGDVTLVLEGDPPPVGFPAVAAGTHAVDPDTFGALVELRHPAAVTGLVALVAEPPGGADLERAARELFADEARARAFAERVLEAWQERAAQARALLPALLGGGADPAAWQALLAARRAALPPQLVPAGWLAATRAVAVA